MRRYLSAGLVMVAVAGAWMAMLPQSALRQPIVFPHARHQATACTVCHAGAATSARARIPEMALCVKCHATAPAGTDAAWGAAVARKTMAWVQVTQLPDHVMFSHRRHTTLGGLRCESCHGSMVHRVAPPGRSPVRLNMTTCLGCHSREGAAEDCAACHR